MQYRVLFPSASVDFTSAKKAYNAIIELQCTDYAIFVWHGSEPELFIEIDASTLCLSMLCE